MVHLLGANAAGSYGPGIPTEADVNAWANAYGMSFPVLADEDYGVVRQFAPGGWNTPAWHLVAPGGEVVIANAPNEPSKAEIEAVLP